MLAPTRFVKLTPQGFRRSAATAYALGGVHIQVAAAVLGNSSIVLLEVYAQFRPESRAAAASAAFKDAL
ncbi:MAG: site-specific integrase [Chthonomonas sp.]|nr:site-specific integrase [Chthonomonas sp.]